MEQWTRVHGALFVPLESIGSGCVGLNGSMARRPMTVRQLAAEFNLDLDEALVTLWDAGFEYIDDIDDRIPPHDVVPAHRALGLGTLAEMRTLGYWERKLGLEPEEFRSHLADLGLSVSANARVLPKGALSKLRKVEPKAPRVMVDDLELQEAEVAPLPSEPEFVWRTIGPEQDCAHLSTDEVIQIHEALEREFAKTPDPVSPAGVRDLGLLESAVYRSHTSLGGEAKYPSPQMTAAALLHSLTHNHPFYNGNKRTALVATLVSLDRNGILLTCTEQALFRYVLRLAQHRVVPDHWSSLADREVLAIADWICRDSRPLSRGERPIKWRELRRNLIRLGCTLEGPLPGNRMKVRRVSTSRGFLGRPKHRELIAHAWYGGEGREVGSDHVHYIRRELQFEDVNGVDSAYFYGTDPREPDEFIGEHRNILKRLARL